MRKPNPYDSQAEIYLIMGQADRALDRYAQVLKIDPSFPIRISVSRRRSVSSGS